MSPSRPGWKIDGSSIITAVIVAGGLVAQWGMYSVRLASLEAQMARVTSATEQLTTAVTKLQVQMEEREKREDRRR